MQKNTPIKTTQPAVSGTDDAPIISEQETNNNGGREFPVVGIGASAGGLAAFEAFFSGMPADVDPGMAFVLVQHLAPDHKSILSDLVRRYTRMTVFDVEDGMAVKPNCAYIIPPGRDMTYMGGTLQIFKPSAPRGQRMPIDFFLRSLALDLRERAICIILSGTGSDGTLGVRAIKGEGGMVIVQTPTSSEYDGMPRSAIATGLVDYELAPGEMPGKIISYVAHANGRKTLDYPIPAIKIENFLKKIFILLRSRTGHDFSQYKPNTVNRRIERRMAIHQIDTLDHYVNYLQQTPTEVVALFQDMLIGVTNFFRDPEVFQLFEAKVLPNLFAGKDAGSTIRVWSIGCSTGEEAYSLAILLQEYMESSRQSCNVQIFATDINSQAIATARAGIYPVSIAADIPPKRLARFFTAESDDSAYQIQKSIRDMLIFSEQNVIKDPPFSKIDLISCRNLLIYIDGDLQKKIIPLFHYALNPGGTLFLGTSETIGEFGRLFATVDRKAKIYQKKDDVQGYRAGLDNFLQPMATVNTSSPQVEARAAIAKRLPLRDLTEKAILQQVAPIAVLVNKKGDILYLHGRTGMYLELYPGDMGTNILQMARDGLSRILPSALQNASMKKRIVRYSGLRVKTNGDFTDVTLTVYPMPLDFVEKVDVPLYLITFEQTSLFQRNQTQEAGYTTGSESSGIPSNGNEILTEKRVIEKLRQELRSKEEYLQSTIEELDTSNEELKSSNEEMQSVNEELQSTNEELETSKEELQSVNEELATVNSELQTKVTDLSQANNDMNNLLAGTGIATIFVDHQLRILRFTPNTSQIINFIKSDLGRPVGHIVSNLVDYDNLVTDVQEVLDTLISKEVDVRAVKGRWYRMRIQPYRTLSNIIEGAVITFVDITEVKKAQDVLAKTVTSDRLAAVLQNTSDAMIVQDMEGTLLAWNPSAQRIYGWSEVEALTMNIRELIPAELQEEAFARVQEMTKRETLEAYHTCRVGKDGKTIPVSIISTALVDETGKTYAITTTERKKSEHAD